MFSESIRRMPRPQEMAGLDTKALREAFHIADLFKPGTITGHFTDLDRLVVGGAMPMGSPLDLSNHKETGRAYFLDRREMGIINVGGPGSVTAASKTFAVGTLDCVYLPMGSEQVTFASSETNQPAKFYFLSCPAHAPHPARMLEAKDATPVKLGTRAAANERTIYKFIHPGGIASCQLVMGLTALDLGSVWNSFPPHTHWRRTEIYFYFGLGENVLAHFLGEPNSTRHLFLHNEEVALSPNWSIHCGCGTGNYKFIWGMAGENQVFDDMDPVRPLDLL